MGIVMPWGFTCIRVKLPPLPPVVGLFRRRCEISHLRSPLRTVLLRPVTFDVRVSLRHHVHGVNERCRIDVSLLIAVKAIEFHGIETTTSSTNLLTHRTRNAVHVQVLVSNRPRRTVGKQRFIEIRNVAIQRCTLHLTSHACAQKQLMLHLVVRRANSERTAHNGLTHASGPDTGPRSMRFTRLSVHRLHHVHVDLTMSGLNERIRPMGLITHPLAHKHTTDGVHLFGIQAVLVDIIPEALHQVRIAFLNLNRIHTRLPHLVEHRFAQTKMRQSRTRFIERDTTIALLGFDALQTTLQRGRQFTTMLLSMSIGLIMQLFRLTASTRLSHIFDSHTRITSE